MSSSKSRLVSGAAHLFNNNEFSDLKIKCEDLQISAHKLVVCTPSDVLHAMCTAGFRESASNTIDLSDDTKRVVYRMVEFLYRGDYKEFESPDSQTTDKDSLDSNPSGARHAVLHAAMFAVADKYNIAALGDVAKNKFKEAIKEITLDTGYFMDVIEYVYNTTPESNRGLRDLIVLQTQTRGAKIIAVPVLNSRLEEIISTTPHFAMDLIQKSLFPASPLSRPCSTCKIEIGDGINCPQCIRRSWLSDQSRNPNDIQRGGGLFGNTQANTSIFANINTNAHPNTGAFGNADRGTRASLGLCPSGTPNRDTHAATDPSLF